MLRLPAGASVRERRLGTEAKLALDGTGAGRVASRSATVAIGVQVREGRARAIRTPARRALHESVLDATGRDNHEGEALALKLQGMRVTDIAELYQVPPSQVGACISRSVAKLRSDPRFLASLL